MILISIILMDLLAGMEFDLFVPSFSQLQKHFMLSPFWVEALLSVNFIGYCISLFYVGKIADHYGRKPIILLGLMIFIIGSIFCLDARTYTLLLFGRFLQGVGVAAPAILSFLIIADAYPIKKQQFYMSMLNGVMNTSVAIAPVIGSYITLYFNWQGNFITLLFLGLITFAMTMIFIPTHQRPNNPETILFQKYFPLFKSKPLLILMINITLMYVPYWIFVGMSPLLYVKDLHVSLTHFGYYQGILALVFALGSVLFGFVLHRFQQQKMLHFSKQMYLMSFLMISIVTIMDTHDPLIITLAFLTFVISQIIPSNLLVPLCLQLKPHAKAKVSAILQGGRLVLAALSLEFAGYIYQGSFQNIGIIILFFILMILITNLFVMKTLDN